MLCKLHSKVAVVVKGPTCSPYTLMRRVRISLNSSILIANELLENNENLPKRGRELPAFKNCETNVFECKIKF